MPTYEILGRCLITTLKEEERSTTEEMDRNRPKGLNLVDDEMFGYCKVSTDIPIQLYQRKTFCLNKMK
jgi:hypothetical protein